MRHPAFSINLPDLERCGNMWKDGEIGAIIYNLEYVKLKKAFTATAARAFFN